MNVALGLSFYTLNTLAYREKKQLTNHTSNPSLSVHYYRYYLTVWPVRAWKSSNFETTATTLTPGQRPLHPCCGAISHRVISRTHTTHTTQHPDEHVILPTEIADETHHIPRLLVPDLPGLPTHVVYNGDAA